jgi:hypothetical protein
MIHPTLDLIAVRESFKYWLINRFSLTEYALNRDPIVKTADNVYCINDKDNGCTARDPDGLFRAIKSPGVREQHKGLCNSVKCRGWCPTLIADRMQVSDSGPVRLIIIDWLDRTTRMQGVHLVQITVASTNTTDDPNGYRLTSLRNALVDALNSNEPPTAKKIPLYLRTDRGYVRPYMENHKHIETRRSYTTPYTMILTPSGNEKMLRAAAAIGTSADRTSFGQAAATLGSYNFTFKLVLCQRTNDGGGFV